MLRKMTAVALFALCCAAVGFSDDEKKPGDDKKPGKGGFDKGKMFDKMDANGDGKLTKDEFVKGMSAFYSMMAAKGAGKGGKMDKEKMGEMLGQRFDAIDADKKGEITKEQFEKAPGPGGKDGKGKGKGKGAPPPKDDK